MMLTSQIAETFRSLPSSRSNFLAPAYAIAIGAALTAWLRPDLHPAWAGFGFSYLSLWGLWLFEKGRDGRSLTPFLLRRPPRAWALAAWTLPLLLATILHVSMATVCPGVYLDPWEVVSKFGPGWWGASAFLVLSQGLVFPLILVSAVAEEIGWRALMVRSGVRAGDGVLGVSPTFTAALHWALFGLLFRGSLMLRGTSLKQALEILSALLVLRLGTGLFAGYSFLQTRNLWVGALFRTSLTFYWILATQCFTSLPSAVSPTTRALPILLSGALLLPVIVWLLGSSWIRHAEARFYADEVLQRPR